MSSKNVEEKELIPEPCRNLAGIQAIAKKQGKNLDKATVAYTLGFEAGKDYETSSSSKSQGVVRYSFSFSIFFKLFLKASLVLCYESIHVIIVFVIFLSSSERSRKRKTFVEFHNFFL